MNGRHLDVGDDADIIADSLTQPEAFGALFHRHAAAIQRYAARRLGEEAADDITGETFLAAFRSRGTYDLARRNALPWLYGIAANLIGKQHRAEVRALKAMARSGHDPVADSWTDLSDNRVTAQAMHGAIARALAELSTADRHVLLLFAWADLSYLEVAEALSIPVGTVRSRLNRARRKVRASLDGEAVNVVCELREALNLG
ncbi:RNA polymerase sigma factor [Streptomyces sp. enrichment culture]|uniref:RNA polymerase sigma factor n=1 Tax=Streptomyces sp. enrichment culture TaxID=1795815 RepID=UPI003F56E67C